MESYHEFLWDRWSKKDWKRQYRDVQRNVQIKLGLTLYKNKGRDLWQARSLRFGETRITQTRCR
jgi:hypothetical protein